MAKPMESSILSGVIKALQAIRMCSSILTNNNQRARGLPSCGESCEDADCTGSVNGFMGLG